MTRPSRDVVQTHNGVYLPPPSRVQIAAVLATLLAVAAGTKSGRLDPTGASMSAVFLTAHGLFWWMRFRKFGRTGRPCATFIDGSLVLGRPGDSRGDLRFAVEDLRQIIVYGPVGERIYRFVRRDGSYVEAVPMWGRQVERAVVAFLQRALNTMVVVAKPQTMFASIRGDGP